MPSHSRRRFLAATATAAASTGFAGCFSRGLPSGDLGRVDGAWPMVGRDPGHTRRAPAGPTDPATVWVTDLDEARAVGTPTLGDGRLYVPVDAVADRARYRHRVHALDAATGERVWQVPLRSRLDSSPALVGDRIVVTALRSTELGRVVGLGTHYGGEEWLYDVDARVTAPPTVQAGVVYVPDWAGRVHALDAGDGSVRWSRTVATGGDEQSLATPAAVLDGTVFVGSLSGETGVLALDATTGEEVWHRGTGSVTAGPVVDGGLVVTRSHGVVMGFGVDGERRWSYNVVADDPRPIAVDDRHVYVPARSRLTAIDREGEEAWTYEPETSPVGTPTVVGDRVFVRGRDRLAALSRADGEELWVRSENGVGSAVVTPTAAFLDGGGGRVVALGE